MAGIREEERRIFMLCFAKKSSMKHVIFDNFSVSWTFFENPLQYESIFIKLYWYPAIPNLLEWNTKP